MDAILTLQKQHLQQRQQAMHADHIQQRQRDATIILTLHNSHSANILLAGTHRGILHIFHSAAFLPPTVDKRQPLSSTASFRAHDGSLNSMDSTTEWLVTGGDDTIHVWSLDALHSLSSSTSPAPSPLHSVTPAQYRLAGRALTAVPRTLAVLVLPSSLLVSSHSNHHVLVTDLRTSTTLVDLTCSSSHPTATLPSTASQSCLSILYMPEPYHVLLTGGADGYVRVYECSSWRLVTTYDVVDNTVITETAELRSRPAIVALTTASTTQPSTPSSIVLCLSASSTLHAFYYPSLTALPPLPLPSPASLLHWPLLFTSTAVQRLYTEPLRVVDVTKCEDGESGSSACCVRRGDRADVDDVWFVGGRGGRIQVMGCLGSVDMGNLQCR